LRGTSSNLEWMAGYYPRFGVTHIDRENGCQRTPKQSAFLLKAMFEHLVEAEKPEL
jgi:beta-glucosidase